MKNHLYLTCSHSEALIASQLEPEDFGTYMAVGTQKLTLGQLTFFEINPEPKSDYFDLARARKECVPHPDGRPKASLYISIYRAMEHVGLPDYGTLYLVTRQGRVMGIEAQGYPAANETSETHLYQELCPVCAADRLLAAAGRFLPVHHRPEERRPRAAHLLRRPARGPRPAPGAWPARCPYTHPKHIEACIEAIESGKGKKTKTVDREHSMEPLLPHRSPRVLPRRPDRREVLPVPDARGARRPRTTSGGNRLRWDKGQDNARAEGRIRIRPSALNVRSAFRSLRFPVRLFHLRAVALALHHRPGDQDQGHDGDHEADRPVRGHVRQHADGRPSRGRDSRRPRCSRAPGPGRAGRPCS